MGVKSKLDWVSFGKLTCFQGSHFVLGGEGGMLMVGVCVSMYVGVLMRFKWQSLGMGWVYWVEVGVCFGVGRWVSEFWTRGMVHIMLILTLSMSTMAELKSFVIAFCNLFCSPPKSFHTSAESSDSNNRGCQPFFKLKITIYYKIKKKYG